MSTTRSQLGSANVRLSGMAALAAESGVTLARSRQPGSADEADESGSKGLVQAILDLSRCRDLPALTRIARSAARTIAEAEGATFVLRDGDFCEYADEDAVLPPLKGRRLPAASCISGWVTTHGRPAVVEDVYQDARIPVDIYHGTFVRSLAMVPIRPDGPVGAIGVYWSRPCRLASQKLPLLQALADSASTAMENARLYSELGRRAREAEDAVRLRDEFLSAAAHELRTPLTSLQLQLDMVGRRARQERDLDVSVRIDRARASSQKLAFLIDTMVDASHLTQADLALSPERFDLVEVVRLILERFSVEAERAACVVALHAPEPVWGTWDRARMSQVFAILLSNAVRHGSGRPILVQVEGSPQNASVSVRDEGPGILQQDLSRLFERFAKVGPDPRSGGLGLGLYLARSIAEAHRGSIVVRSQEEGPGVTFTVVLPRS